MRRSNQLLLIACVTILVCSSASHIAIGLLKIKANWGVEKQFGKEYSAQILLHSSSPGYDGIDWSRVSALLGMGIESWATPGSSPSEWEWMHSRARDPRRFFVAFSAYDLNDDFLCDFRAEIVPFSQTIQDLRETNADWHFSRRLITQYAVMSTRQLFPTVGRSDGVLTGIRAYLQRMAGKSIDSGETPQFAAAGESTISEKLSDWDQARFQRRLLLMRGAVGQPFFSGPKKRALQRLLARAESEGPLVLLVLPNAPAYRRYFQAGAVEQAFETELTELQRDFPRAVTIRLDQLADLDSDDYFYDFVHLNMFGQRIATSHLLRRLGGLGGQWASAHGEDLH